MRQFLAAHSSPEIAEIIAFEQIEPQGEERADLRVALQTAALVNVLRGGGKPATVKDFLLDFTAEPKADPGDKTAVAAATRSLVQRAAQNAVRLAEAGAEPGEPFA